MIEKIKEFFNVDGEPIIKFCSNEGGAYSIPLTDIKLAKDVYPDWVKSQKDRPAKEKFMNCPGMVDYMKSGYIVPAWCDFKIKATRQGTTIIKTGPAAAEYKDNQPLDFKLVDNFTPIDKDEKGKFVTPGLCNKMPVPWGVITKPGWSFYLIPAYYQNPFLKDLFMYPGVIDGDVFHQINWVFTALHEGEWEVSAGTPLLQIIPFKRETITAISGKATVAEFDKHKYSFPSRIRAAYRQLFYQKKDFKLEKRK